MTKQELMEIIGTYLSHLDVPARKRIIDQIHEKLSESETENNGTSDEEE